MRVLMIVVAAIGFAVLAYVIVKFRSRPIQEAAVPGEDWRPTNEHVHDASTGRTLRIWIDPADGSRYSIAEMR